MYLINRDFLDSQSHSHTEDERVLRPEYDNKIIFWLITTGHTQQLPNWSHTTTAQLVTHNNCPTGYTQQLPNWSHTTTAQLVTHNNCSTGHTQQLPNWSHTTTAQLVKHNNCPTGHMQQCIASIFILVY